VPAPARADSAPKVPRQIGSGGPPDRPGLDLVAGLRVVAEGRAGHAVAVRGQQPRGLGPGQDGLFNPGSIIGRFHAVFPRAVRVVAGPGDPIPDGPPRPVQEPLAAAVAGPVARQLDWVEVRRLDARGLPR